VGPAPVVKGGFREVRRMGVGGKKLRMQPQKKALRRDEVTERVVGDSQPLR